MQETKCPRCSEAELSRSLRDPWLCCDPPRHVFAFDVANLRSIVERAGLNSISVRSVYCIDDYYSPAKFTPGAPRFGRRLANLAVRTLLRLVASTATTPD